MNSASLKNPREPGPWRLAAFPLVLAGLLALLLLVNSCAAPREVIRWQRDTTYIERLQVDSIYKRDSVYIREKGDTVYIYKERVRDRYRLLRDTVRLVKVDSIAVERIKEVKVEKPLSWGQRLKLRAFWGLLALVAGLGLWTFRKPLLKLIRI